MFWKLYRWIVGDNKMCKHKWETFHTYGVYPTFGNTERPTQIQYHQMCENCGEIKIVKAKT